MYVVRLYDMFDGWINVFGPAELIHCFAKWNELTCNGTKKAKYSDGDYYEMFPANTTMLMTPQTLGR